MKKLKQLIKIVANIFFVIGLMLAVLLVFYLAKEKISGKAPSVAGLHMYIVLSGSMNPAFDTGSLVFVKAQDPSQIQEGDVITFRGSGRQEELVSHRVVAIDKTLEEITFTTKGDANEIVDPSPVSAKRLVGKIVFAIPYMGYLMDFIQTKQGVLIFVLIPALILLFSGIKSLFVKYKYLTGLVLLISLSLLGTGTSLAYFTSHVESNKLATFSSNIVKIELSQAEGKFGLSKEWVDKRDLQWTITNKGTENVNLRTKIIESGSSPREGIKLSSNWDWKQGMDGYYYYVNTVEVGKEVEFPLQVLFDTWEPIQDYGINIEAEAIQASNNAIDYKWPDNHYEK